MLNGQSPYIMAADEYVSIGSQTHTERADPERRELAVSTKAERAELADITARCRQNRRPT